MGRWAQGRYVAKETKIWHEQKVVSGKQENKKHTDIRLLDFKDAHPGLGAAHCLWLRLTGTIAGY